MDNKGMFVGQKSQETIVVGISNPSPLSYLRYNEELLKLGYQLETCINCANDEWDNMSPDICILSLDTVETRFPTVLHKLNNYDIPYIINLNADFPVDGAAGEMQKAVGFLFGTPTLNQLALEIEVGLYLHRERSVYSKRIERVSLKIQNNRDIGVAIGLLMAQTHLNALDVFSILKSYSRNGRLRIATVAKEIIHLYEQQHPDLFNNVNIEDLQQWLSEQLDKVSEEAGRK
jgi:hypothetical protein